MSKLMSKDAFEEKILANPSWRRFTCSTGLLNASPKPQVTPTAEDIQRAKADGGRKEEWEVDMANMSEEWMTKDGRQIITTQDIYDTIVSELAPSLKRTIDLQQRIRAKYSGILDSDISLLVPPISQSKKAAPHQKAAPSKKAAPQQKTVPHPRHDIVSEQEEFWKSPDLKWLRKEFEDYLANKSNKGKGMWKQCEAGLHVLAFGRVPKFHCLKGSVLGQGNSSLEDAEILLRTTRESIEEHRGQHNSKPMLIRDVGPEADQIAKSRPYETLDTWKAMLEKNPDLELDVQNMDEGEEPAKRVKVSDFLSRLSNGVSLVQGRLPNNALGLEDHTRTLPEFLQRSKDSEFLGLFEKEHRTGKLEKKKNAIESLDKTSLQHFKIFGQKGSVSSWHKDMPSPGTWVRMEGSGLKLWAIVNDMDANEIKDYAEKSKSNHGLGDFKMTRDFPAVFLRDDDTFVMRQGLLNVHCVLTLKDSLMSGGMFWENRRLMWTLNDWKWVGQNPHTSNEMAPKEARALLDYAMKRYKANPRKFPDIPSADELQDVIDEISDDLPLLPL